MSIKSIIKEIRRTLTFWKSIKEPPYWVQKAYQTKIKRIPTDMHAYLDEKVYYIYFKEKHYIYSVAHNMGQGGSIFVSWYKKKRIK